MDERAPHEDVILGAGLAGMAAAIELGEGWTVFEKNDRPGGLVRSKIIDVPGWGRFWFDHVLHLLYFSDPDTEYRVRHLMGDQLAACPPVAFVETAAGVTRYPFQMHLAGIAADVRLRCVADLVQTLLLPRPEAANLEETLLNTFGKGICEAFLLPYNRKMWARPLSELKGTLAWTVTPPDIEQVLRGAMTTDANFAAYNVAGCYPRPPTGALLRGMEVLSQELARRVPDLRTGLRVAAIDTDARRLRFATPDGEIAAAYRQCISTLPLPAVFSLCSGVPKDILQAVARLKRNRVWSVALCVRGDAPSDFGHWRYYSNEDLCFTRLVLMNAFDPAIAPEGAWGLLAEVTERGEAPLPSRKAIIERVVGDIISVGVLADHRDLLACDAWCVDPAYVVFDDKTEETARAANAWLELHGIHSLGRYGRWEYSSMSQVMRDGFACGIRMKASC
jgi:protoporphyrinogen oxidase